MKERQKILEERFVKTVKKYLDIFIKPSLEKKDLIVNEICKRNPTPTDI